MASFADLALPIPRDERDPTAAPSESAEDRASDVIIVNQAEGSTATQRPAGQGPGQDGSRPSAAPKKRRHIPEEDLAPISEVLLHRLTTIKEGDNVLLRLPSDQIKAVVASKDGLLNLGKFGAFPCKELLGLHYDITYELYSTTPDPDDDGFGGRPGGSAGSSNMPNQFGQGKGKKTKKQKKADAAAAAEQDGRVKSNPGWAFALRPLRRPTVADAVIDDITETNEFIDDTDAVKQAMLTQEEILEMRASGASAEEIMEAQMKRHERFDLKTDFSKEKWRKKKEKKYTQTVHPIAPSAYNIARHQFARLPQSILHLRDDTLSQLLSTANIRPGGRYMVVDDTGGLVTAAILERMGCMGRIMTFTDADSPPAWGVLNTMNFGQRELACVKWLNWLQAEENYEPQPLPDESQLPEIAPNKKFMRERKHLFQLAELNATRDELHRGGWDGLIMATELNPLSVLARLSPYLAGSANIVIYSPHLQVLAEVLVHAKSTPIYLNPALTESWSRTYQVLPGRTHPLMTTSATGGYLLHMIRVFDSDVDTRTFQYDRLKKNKEANKKRKAAELADTAENAGTSAAAQADDTSGPEGAAAQTAAGHAVDDMQEGGMEEDDAGTTRSGDETAEGDVDMLL